MGGVLVNRPALETGLALPTVLVPSTADLS
jgi:hypothetical protein